MTGFSLFGTGAVPDMFEYMLERGEGERLARLIIEGSKGTKVAPDFLRTVAQVLVEWYGQRPEPMPPFVLEANAAALGLISPDTGKGRPAAGVRELLGIPRGVDHVDFMESAGRDAAAFALSVAPQHEDALAKALDKIIYRVNEKTPDWQMPARAISEASRKGGRKGFEANTVTAYRRRAEYRHIVTEVAGHFLLKSGATVPEPLDLKAIRQRVLLMSSEDAIGLVGEIRSVWSARSRPRRGMSVLDIEAD